MINDKRSRQAPIPSNLQDILTESQRKSLRRVENFGWQLKFVRRPRFEPPMVVVENASGLTIGILEESGQINFEPNIVLRTG